MEFLLTTRVSNEMLHDIGFIQSYVTNFCKRRIKYIRPYKVIGGVVINTGIDGDDFIKNITTISVKFKAFKAPRIAFKENRKFK